MTIRTPSINFAWFYWILLLTLWGTSTGNARTPNTPNTFVVVWEYGENEGVVDGLTNVPAGLTNVVQVAAGDGFCMALNGDGTVTAWSGDDQNDTNIIIPMGFSNIVAISAGQNFAVALDSTGNIHGWGDNTYGELDFPPPLPPEPFETYVGISGGNATSLALQPGGTMSIAGDPFSEARIPSAANNIVAIAAGAGFYLALRSDGTVVAWGNDLSGGTDVPAGLSNVVAIAAEENNGFALQANGVVVGWGVDYDGEGQIASGSGISNVVSICGDMALLSNGTAVPLGDAIDKGLEPPEGLSNVVAVDGLDNLCMAIVKTGKPAVLPTINEIAYSGSSVLLTSSAAGTWPLSYQWQHSGTNLPGADQSWLTLTNVQTANTGTYSVTVTNVYGAATSLAGVLSVLNFSPIIVNQPANAVVPSGNTVEFSVTAVGSQPMSFQWLLNNKIIPGATNASLVIPEATNSGQYGVMVTNAFGSNLSPNAALTFAPSVVVDFGDTSSVTNIPPNLTNAVEIVNEGTFALALNANGSVVGWGNNGEGQTNIPVGITNASQIAAGSDYSLALQNGRVFAWGDNSSGECDVPYLTNAIGLFAGNGTAALLSDGSVVPWGDTYVPFGLSNVIAMAEGGCGLALQGDGQVVAWGVRTMV